MAKRKKKKEVNIDLTSVSMMIIGIIFGVVIYSQELGNVGKFIKYGILGGFFGRLTYAIPVILVVLGLYAIFRDFSRLKLKSFQIIILRNFCCGIIFYLR